MPTPLNTNLLLSDLKSTKRVLCYLTHSWCHWIKLSGAHARIVRVEGVRYRYVRLFVRPFITRLSYKTRNIWVTFGYFLCGFSDWIYVCLDTYRLSWRAVLQCSLVVERAAGLRRAAVGRACVLPRPEYTPTASALAAPPLCRADSSRCFWSRH